MRTWPGFAAPEAFCAIMSSGICRATIRCLRVSILAISIPQAYQHALDMLDERIAALKTAGHGDHAGTAAYDRLKSSIVPPYDATKFPNKWRKMWRDQPARTLMAHLGKDSYSHIHYDSDQARTISVREAARLQSFPDGFVFCGTMNSAGRQIGNAVPPLLAKALATTIRATLHAASETESDERRRAADSSLGQRSRLSPDIRCRREDC